MRSTRLLVGPLVVVLLCVFASSQAQQWKFIAPMANARSSFFAFELPNGKIIVIGGRNENSVLKQCEIYDPVTNTWSATGSMHKQRMAYAATMMNDGKIFVSGGLTNLGTNTEATCEIYDPATGTWTLIASNMSLRRESHVCLLLPNGNIFIAAGMDGPGPNYSSCEIYDPVAGTFTAAPSLSKAQTATSLYYSPQLGGILFQSGHAGGASGVWYKDMEFLSDQPGSNWTILSSSITAHSSYSYQPIQLADGRVIAMSGATADQSASPLVEQFHPVTQQWSTIATMAIPRYFGATVQLAPDSIMITGGYIPNGVNSALTDCTVLKISNSSLTTGPPLKNYRWGHVAIATIPKADVPCRPKKRIYVFGGHMTRTPGSGYGSATNTCEVLDIGKNTTPGILSLNNDTINFSQILCDAALERDSFLLMHSGCDSVRIDSIRFHFLSGRAGDIRFFPQTVTILKQGENPLSVPVDYLPSVDGTSNGMIVISTPSGKDTVWVIGTATDSLTWSIRTDTISSPLCDSVLNTIEVINTSCRSITIDSLNLPPELRLLAGQLPVTIPKGKSVRFSVRYIPTSEGTLEDTIDAFGRFHALGGDRQFDTTLKAILQGVSTVGNLVLSIEPIASALCDTVTGSLHIENNSCQSLTIDSLQLPPELELISGQLPLTLLNGSTATIGVRYHPGATGLFTDTIIAFGRYHLRGDVRFDSLVMVQLRGLHGDGTISFNAQPASTSICDSTLAQITILNQSCTSMTIDSLTPPPRVTPTARTTSCIDPCRHLNNDHATLHTTIRRYIFAAGSCAWTPSPYRKQHSF